MMTLSTDYGIQQDVLHGRVPVISWNCGDDAPPNTAKNPLSLIAIVNGSADSDLGIIKAQLASFKYPNGTQYPIMLRYFWEFNINAANPAPDYDNAGNGNNGCFVQPGTKTTWGNCPSPKPAIHHCMELHSR
jgi:hypothetical protein